MSSAAASRPWQQLWDPDNEQHYFYNESTGESSWEAPAGWGAATDDDGRAVVPPKTARKGRPGGDSDSGDSDSDGSESGDAPMLTESRDAVHIQKVFDDTETIVRAYKSCFYFHACCCEGPAAFVEGVFRAVWYLSLGTLALLFLGWRKKRRKMACKHLREACLFGAAALALGVPCGVQGAYAAFDADADDWELRPIPTVLGFVDSRRFFVVAFGQGASAANVRADDGVSDDSWPGTILHRPYAVADCAGGFFMATEGARSPRGESVRHHEEKASDLEMTELV
ncbi:hypothetical protein M885DRAFT_538928 [Pelagophyceae sp. CCMP2097]|nr:hypothetical protein M885DRAFT_538928 [Pelagophyceae sp. CCMP2097]